MTFANDPLVTVGSPIAPQLQPPPPPPLPATGITSPGQALSPPTGNRSWESDPLVQMPSGSAYDRTANSIYLPSAVNTAATPEQRLAASQTEATGFWSGVDTGIQESAWRAAFSMVGAADKKLPDSRIGENSPFSAKLGAAVAQIPDFVAMGIIGIPGAMAGTAIAPGFGTAAGLFTGGAAVSGFRKWYFDRLLHGEMTREDFIRRSGEIAWEGAIGGTTNVVFGKAMEMMGARHLVAAGIPKPAADAIVSRAVEREAGQIAQTFIKNGAPKEAAMEYALRQAYQNIGLDAAQMATAQAVRAVPMNAVTSAAAGIVGATVTGAAMQWRLPSWDEFAVQGVLMGGLHMGTKAGAAVLGRVWAETNRLPGEVARDILHNPSVLTEMIDVMPAKKASEAQFMRGYENASRLDAEARLGKVLTAEETKAREAFRDVPVDASYVLRYAVELSQKTDRTPVQENFLNTVREGSYESYAKGVLSKPQLKLEAEKKIDELEKVAAQARVATKELTPEQRTQIEEAQTKHDQMVAFTKGKYKDKPTEMHSRLRNLERDFESEKLAIAGEATTKQLAKRAVAATMNYVGKDVVVNGEAGRVVGSKIRTVSVKFEDGRVVDVPRDQVSVAPVTAPDMTVGMTKAQLEEYTFLKEKLETDNLAEISDRYGINITDEITPGALPASVAKSPVYQTLKDATEIAIKDRENLPPGFADATARIYYAMYQSLANRFTAAGHPRSIEQVFQEHMMHIVGEGEGALNQALPTRWPTKKGLTPSVNDPMLADLQTLRTTPDQFAKAVDAVATESGMRVGDGTPEARVEIIISRIVDNLLWLYNQVPAEIRARSKQWYDGAERIAEGWSLQYGISKAQASGMLAALSPQKDWFMNVTMAERVIDILHTKMDHKFDAKMRGSAFQILLKDGSKSIEKQENTSNYELVKGMTLREAIATGNREAVGMWIRSYDEAYHSGSYAVIHPEGAFGANVTNLSGSEGTRAWGDFGALGKAASIFVDGSPDNINRMLGAEHKVRNFYNNIFNPRDPRFITIDTHAVAAALLTPFGGSDRPVTMNFGGSGKSKETGVSGTYAIYYEAYIQAAERMKILPREMQSITWEAVRGLFQDTFKTPANQRAIKQIWDLVDQGALPRADALTQIHAMAKGIKHPDWWDGKEPTAHVVGSKSYVPDAPQWTGRKVAFAASGYGTALTARLGALPYNLHNEIVEAVARSAAMKAFTAFELITNQAKKERKEEAFRKVYPEMGVDIANDVTSGMRHADLLADGKQAYETRDTDSLRPHVGKMVAIVRTGEGAAKAIGTMVIGEPIKVDAAQYRAMMSDMHLIPERSAVGAEAGGVKYLYPITEAKRFDREYDVGRVGAKNEVRRIRYPEPKDGKPGSMLDAFKGSLQIVVSGHQDITGPGVSLQMSKGASMAKIQELTKVLGYALRQDEMQITSPEAFKGGNEMGVVQIHIPKDMVAVNIEALYSEIRSNVLDAKGKELLGGHTTEDGAMGIIVPYGDRVAIAGKISEYLGDRHDVTADSLFVQSLGKGRDDYGLPGRKKDRSGFTEASLGQYASRIRESVAADLETRIAAAEQLQSLPRDDGVLRQAFAGREGGTAEGRVLLDPNPWFVEYAASKGGAAPSFREVTTDPQSFHAAITAAKAAHPSGASVYVYSVEEYAGMRTFLAEGGKAGVAIKGNYEPIRNEVPLVRFKRIAEDIENQAPTVAGGMVRLWRGNRQGEVGQNPSFTNSLEGIALPFREAYGGSLSYVDVPTKDLAKYENKVGAVPGAEFTLPKELAAQARDFQHVTSTQVKLDIVSVFNADPNLKGVSLALIQLAVDHGGRKLDAFDTRLPKMYEKGGFRIVSRLRWNEAEKPPGWNKADYSEFNNGEPDVVFMVYDPPRAGQPGVYAKDSSQAVAMQDATVKALSREYPTNLSKEALRQGNRGFYDPEALAVGFLKAANPSTAIHEGWHFFFDYMVEIAKSADAPPDIRADVGKMFDYLGVKSMEEWDALKAGTKGTNEYQRWVAAHEKMAESGEEYVRTQNFPVAGLRSIFSKFQEWMIETYKTLNNLNVHLTPEIREVFDGMIGKDDVGLRGEYGELAKAQKGKELMPGFKAELVSAQPYPDMMPVDKMPYQIALWRMNTNSDYEAAILRIQEVNAETIKGPKTWNETDYNAARMAGDAFYDGNARDVGAMMDKLGATGRPVDEVYRAKVMLLQLVVADQVRQRTDILAKWDAGFHVSLDEQISYLTSIDRTHLAFTRMIEERAAIGRALNQMKQYGSFFDPKESMGNRLFQTAKERREMELQMRVDELMQDYRKRFGPDASVEMIARLDGQNQTLREQKKFVEAALKATTFDKFIEYWKGWGLLSGPWTTVVNVAGTSGHMWTRPFVDMIATGVGQFRTGGEHLHFRDSLIRMTAMFDAVVGGAKIVEADGVARNAYQRSWETLKTDGAAAKLDVYAGAVQGRLGEVNRFPFRVMSAGDTWTQHMYRAGEMAVLASHQAISENLRPGTAVYGKRVAELVMNPTEAMAREGDLAAARHSFNEARGGYGVAGVLSYATSQIPLLNLVFPFKRTPINVLDEMMHMTGPLAPLISKTWREAYNSGGIARDRVVAEALLGTAVFGLTVTFAAAGNVTGNGPVDPGKRRGWLASNQPYSIKIGNAWYSYARIQPVGTLIGMAADVFEVKDHLSKEDGDHFAKMVAVGFANAVTNQTFLKGFSDFTNAMSDPDRYGAKYAQNLIASQVPSFMAQTAAMADPDAREIYSIVDAIKNRVWGLRQTLEPKIDFLGQRMPSPERALYVLPVVKKDIPDNAAALEVERLGVKVPTIPKKFHMGRMTGKLGDVELSPEERTKFGEEAGKLSNQLLNQLVGNPAWKMIPERTPMELAAKRQALHKMLEVAHQYGATVAVGPQKRAALLQDIYTKFTAPVGP